MKKFYFSLMILFLLCGAASAHIVYTTEDGKLGLIKIDSVSSADIDGIKYYGSADSVVASYWENNTSNGAGNSKIILITPKESNDATVSGDTAVRFSSYSDLSRPIDSTPIILNGTYNKPIICGTNSGGSLYLATDASLREYKTSDFRFFNSYTYKSEDVAPNPKIKSVMKNDNRVYLLVSPNNNISNDLVITLDGTLKQTSEYSAKWNILTSQDTYTMNFISDSRIVVGCADGVYQVTNAYTASLVSSDFPVVSICPDRISGFYYVVQSTNNDGTKTNTLRHYTNTTTDTAVSTISNISGSTVHLVRDSIYNVLGAMIGEQIFLLKMEDDSVIQTFSANNLGGTPISIAASSTTGNSADTSSGCMLSGAGAAVAVFLSILLKNKRR